MNKLENYISIAYKNSPFWFTEEINKGGNSLRIAKVFSLKNYLNGQHNVLTRTDMKYQEKVFKVKKLILQNAKTILNFHSTYLLGNPVSLTGSEDLVRAMQDTYNYGGYNDIDYKLIDKLNKFGDSYEYIYKEGDRITSKVIASEDSYPVFSDDGTYIAFIEHWTNTECISYYNVYTEDTVTEYTNEGNELSIIGEYKNVSGLPIHYHGISDFDDRFGDGLLSDIVPVLDEIEDLMSKLGDSIYVNSLSPLLLVTGQPLVGSMDSNGVGYNVNLEVGSDMKYVSATMDYQTISFYLTTLQNQLNMIAYMPSILGGGTNISNVSEISLKLLYQIADCYAMITERAMRNGFNKRFNVIRKLIGMEDNSQYVNVTFNYSRPQNASELLDNLQKQFEMNSISIQSIIEQSPLTVDSTMELERLKGSLDLDKGIGVV